MLPMHSPRAGADDPGPGPNAQPSAGLRAGTTIFDLGLADLSAQLQDWGEPAFRARQIWHALYRDLAGSAAEITTLPAPLRERLQAAWSFNSLSPLAEVRSTDGQTRKQLFQLSDGKSIEAVLMGYARRQTTCISTQAGCAMGCVFCATGQMGFRRNLSAGEIVQQVIWFARGLRAAGTPLTNIVVMGMGEPFHNYAGTMAAVDRLTDPDGFAFSPRRITISTVGLVPQIRRFADEHRQVNLAISLHAATDGLRSELLPVNNRYPVAEVFEAARYYTVQTRRRVTFEWALIAGRNDTREQARAFAALARGLLCHVNVIPLNPTRGYAGQASTRDRVQAFLEILRQHGIAASVRVRRGIDVDAGCGQLAVRAASGDASPAPAG